MIYRKVACPGSKILPTIVASALACENRLQMTRIA